MDIQADGGYISGALLRWSIPLFRSIISQVPPILMLSIDDVLVARDFSPVSDRALRYGLDVAARTGANLHVLYAEVLHDTPNREQDRRSPAEGLDTFREQLRQEGSLSDEALDAVSVEEVVRRDVSPGPAILNYAGDVGIDLISMGTHGRRGPGRILLGSVAEEVVRKATQPVLSVRGMKEGTSSSRPDTVNRILVPVDFSDFSREALHCAKEWADLYGASLDVLHVVVEDLHPTFYIGGVTSIYDVEPDIEQKVLDKLDSFVSEVPGPDTDVQTHVAVGSAPSEIAEFADDHDSDLVSMSTHGRTGLDRFLLGSVAEKVIRHVSCPVLTVKAFGKSIAASGSDVQAAAE